MTYKPGDIVTYAGSTTIGPNIKTGMKAENVSFVMREINGLVVKGPYHKFSPWAEQETIYVDVLLGDQVNSIPIDWLKIVQ